MTGLRLARPGPAGGVFGAGALLGLSTLCGADRRIVPQVSQDLGRLTGRVLLPLILLGPFLATQQVEPLLHAMPLLLGLVFLGRSLSCSLCRWMRSLEGHAEPTVIVGAGERGAQLTRALLDHPEYGLHPVGFVDALTDEALPLPLIGTIDDLDRIVADLGVRRVIVAYGVVKEPDIVRVLRACRRSDVDVHVLPRFFDLGFSGPHRADDHVWGFPLVHLQRTSAAGARLRSKRANDIVVAAIALVLTAPVQILAALAVRLTSPGPVLFRQVRVGRDGRLIEVPKFRTLRVNDDSDTRWSVDGDPRQTAVGRFLRMTSLDELPQLYSVLRGDMAIVGPRPERPHFVEGFSSTMPDYQYRHRLPVGITGWAQIHGLRGDTSISDRVRFDNRYIEDWSFGLDLLIVARTFKAVASTALRAAAGPTRTLAHRSARLGATPPTAHRTP